MDFIAAPGGASHWLVPDLGGPEYDNLEFHDYPARMGWNLKKLQGGDIGWHASLNTVDDTFLLTSGGRRLASIRHNAAQFLQTWLYFGLISSFLRRRIFRGDHTVMIVKDDKTMSALTSAKFQDYGKEWFAAITQMSEPTRNSEFDRCSKILEAGSACLSDLELLERNTSAPPLLAFNISLCLRSSMGILSEWIVNFTRSAHLSASIKNKPRRRLPSTYCPNILTRGSHSELDVYYSDLIGNQRHTDHSKCIESACVAYTIDEATYQTRHSDSCNKEACVDVAAPLEGKNELPTIQSILRDGRIPLVRLPEQDETTTNSSRLIEVSAHEPGTEKNQAYIAISHVWADGLGNTVENSLPSCQITKLKLFLGELTSTSNLSKTGFFWMDTLCVPLSPKETRKAAIRVMRETYIAAEATLVLDASLMDRKAPKNPEETLMRILYSNWMTRLWTLQEGVLSSRLFFQFADLAVELESVLLKVTDMPAYSPAMGMTESATSALMKLVFPAESSVSHELLTYYWRNLGHRSTSREKDVPVCVATLIGSPLDKIVEQEDEVARMEAFWSSQELVPGGFLFTPGLRLENPPYRWALRSLLQSAANSWIRASTGRSLHPATSTLNGLTIEGLPALLIHNLWLPEQEEELFFWIVHKETGQALSVINVRTSLDFREAGVTPDTSNTPPSEDIRSRYGDLAQYSSIFLLLEDNLDVMARNTKFDKTGRGCVVASSMVPASSDDGTIEVQYLSSVVVGLVENDFDFHVETWAEDVDEKQKWLIS